MIVVNVQCSVDMYGYRRRKFFYWDASTFLSIQKYAQMTGSKFLCPIHNLSSVESEPGKNIFRDETMKILVCWSPESSIVFLNCIPFSDDEGRHGPKASNRRGSFST